MMGRAILPHFLLLSSSPPQLSSSLYYLHLYLNSPILYAVHILIQSQAGHSLDFQANISKLGANSSKCKMRDALLVSVATPLSHSRSLLLQRVLRALRSLNATIFFQYISLSQGRQESLGGRHHQSCRASRCHSQ
ncbi:uncharacterized protein LOC110603118 isoform X4 [Manihot esculenta]|uniref:uncharacterized protein LOC110603118 isoform X4 n=1 Tax=Manihot esculenta TaxID=3983 RepID=UPI000B5D8133|nr:uncharacterized protein LOC110603118 isoform X4 [Manihot esculenta]